MIVVKVSVVITTYNKPDYLARALVSYLHQDDREGFEVIVADDGSGQSTRDVLEAFGKPFPLEHVWQEDSGFRKTRILNRAIKRSHGDYLIFTDDDCIARADFVATHRRLARKGWFLSGGVEYLPDEMVSKLTPESIGCREAFDPRWLSAQGLRLGWRSKINKPSWLGPVLDRISPTRATFNGHNTSVWKADVVAVNGFDERLGYGGLDRELGERLTNNGVRGVSVRYRALCLHLNHPRAYRDESVIARNNAIRSEVRRTRRKWTDFGLVKGGSLE